MERCLISPVGVIGMPEGCCSRVGEWLFAASFLGSRLDDLVVLELGRLASVPCIDSLSGSPKELVPLSFLDRVLSVQVLPETARDGTILVEIEVAFVGEKPVKAELRIATERWDAAAYKAIWDNLREAGGP